MSLLLSRILVLTVDPQVVRGYVGDRSSQPVWGGRIAFDILGTGYQRPFELATLRLNHMVNILPRCRLLHAYCAMPRYLHACTNCTTALLYKKHLRHFVVKLNRYLCKGW